MASPGLAQYPILPQSHLLDLGFIARFSLESSNTFPMRNLAHIGSCLLISMLAGNFLLAQEESQFGSPSVVDSLEALVQTTHDPEERLQLFYDLTSEYNNVNPRESIRFADSTIKWARQLGNEKREYQGAVRPRSGVLFSGRERLCRKICEIGTGSGARNGHQARHRRFV